MPVAEITTTEAKSIKSIRQAIPALSQSSKYDDGFVLRWLRSQDGDVDKAIPAIEKTLLFRKVWNLDLPKNKWRVSEIMRKHYGYGYPGVDKEGCPVLIQLFGQMDVEGLMKNCSASDYIHMALYVVEEGLELCNEAAIRSGKPYQQMVFIMDLLNMTSTHYSYKPFANSYLTMLTCFQENYPLLFKKIFVLRAPTMASYAFQLLNPFLGGDTKQSIEMLGDSWQETIFDLIDRDQLPEYLGGTLDEASSKIHMGEPIPSTAKYISGPEDDKLQHLTVYSADRQYLEYEVETAGQRLCWRYKVENEDIGFAVYYNQDGKATEVSEMEPVFPPIRLECSLIPETGYVVCEKPGLYVVEFDNYYSWFSLKEVLYKIEVK